MTKIYISGILGKAFGNLFELKIKNGFDALKGIDANRNGFLKKIKDLSSEGIHYQLIIDNEIINNSNQIIEKRKIKSIYIVPVVYGSGQAVATGLNLVITEGAKAGTLSLMGQIVAGAVNTLISVGISLAVSYLTQTQADQASSPSQGPQAVGGASAAVEARGKNYVFSNAENTASQGDAVPVGYGKFKCNSKIIEAASKNYPTSIDNVEEFTSMQLSSLFTDYIS
jgi:predicted phage tail protein